MSSNFRRTSRPGTLVPFMFAIAFTALLAGSVLDSFAQVLPIQANPTVTPTPRVTEEPEGPDGIVANPTQAPTDEPIDDIVANPTSIPPDEPIDDIQANPTEPSAIDDEAIPTGTVRIVKRLCPPGVIGDALLTDYLQICTEQHDGVEFVLNDVNGAQAGTIAGWQVEWTGVDPGVFNITETIPDGYGDPIVFCGFIESPGGGIQHPSRQESAGGVVAGSFPDAIFEYACYWMNVPLETGLGGPDDITSGDGDAVVTVDKRTCPIDTPAGQELEWYRQNCTEIVSGATFTLQHPNGSSSSSVTDGHVEWTGLATGPISIQESIPAGYGDPIVFCGWYAVEGDVVLHAPPALVPSAGGFVEAELAYEVMHFRCDWFNVKTGPGSFADPGSTASNLVTRKWTCPDGTLEGQDRDYYQRVCELMLTPVEFTLTHANGGSTKSTSDGFVEWDGLPLGDFTLEEAIPSGYGAPVVFCGWWAEYGGSIYDAFPQLVVLAAAGVIDGAITVPNTEYFCDVFNMEGGIDDLQANPTETPAIDDVQANTGGNSVRVVKRDCPLGVVEDAVLSEYLQICTQLHDGVELTLSTTAGDEADITTGGEALWTGVTAGAFEIEESIPAGYGDPIVFCGYTESPGGGVQHPSLQESAAGVVSGTFPQTAFEYVCYWLNVPEETGLSGADDFVNAGGGGLSSLTVRNWGCGPGDWSEVDSLEVLEASCAYAVNGAMFTVTHANSSSSKPISDGQATWQGLPLAPYTIDEAVPGGYGDPIVACSMDAFGLDDAWLLTTISFSPAAADGQFELTLDPPADLEIAQIGRMDATCTFYNIPTGPDGFVNPTDVSNSLTVRAWTCPGSTEPSANKLEMEAQCELASNSHEFTLITVLDESTQATSPDLAFWGDLAYGPFSLQETVPAGFGEPVAFCGWTAFHEGIVYDAFPQLVPSPGGLIEGEISVPNTSYFCDVFNIHGQGQGNGQGQGQGQGNGQGNADSGTVRVVKRSCPLGIVEDTFLSDYLLLCPQVHDEVAFTLNHPGGSEDGVTEDGVAEWTDVDLGAFEIVETLPEGYKDPIVFCGFTEEPGGGVQHPSLQAAPGGVVAGSLEIAGAEYVCYWMNIKETGAADPGFGASDSFTIPEDLSNTLVARTWLCPAGTDPDAHLLEYFDLCQLAATPVELTLTNDEGVSVQETSAGRAEWNNVAISQFTLKETIPAGYEEPIIWCGWTAFYNGAVYDAFSTLRPSQDGLVIGEISVPNTYYVCDFMNIAVEIDDVQANPTATPAIDDVTANPPDAEEPFFRAHAYACPPGYDTNTGDWLMVITNCSIPIEGVEFSFTDASGSSTQALTGDFVQWDQVGIGEGQTVELSETYPDGYTEPHVLCSVWPTGAGDPFDWNYQPVEAVDGTISVSPNLDAGETPLGYFAGGSGYDCYFLHFAVEAVDDFQANPTEPPTEEPIDDIVANPAGTGTLTVHKWICPASYDPLAGDALADCAEAHDGVVFDLVNHAEGEPDFQATTGDVIDGAAVFEPQPGTYSLKEQIPDGYGQPFLWNCTGLDNPAIPEPPISTINFFRIVIDANQVIECDWMNVPIQEGLGGADDLQANPTAVPTDEPIDDVAANPVPGTLTINLAQCNPDSNPGIDIYSQDVEYFSQWCSYPSTEFEFTVSSEGGFGETTTTAGFTASFAEVPVANITITETVPEGWNVPMTLCWSDLVGSTGWQIGNEVAWSVQSGEAIECLWVNVIGDDSHVVTVGNLACPEGVDPTDDYWVAIGECDEGLGGVEFTLTTDAGEAAAVTDVLGGAVWVGVSLGESGEIQITADVPDGYGEPEVWCLSYPEVEPADPFDHVFTQYQVQNGTITATPEQHEPFRFSCVLFNIVDDGPGQGN